VPGPGPHPQGADAEGSGDVLAARLRPFTTTIFSEMSELAVATGSINLGQGFPDTDGPEELRRVAMEAIAAGRNQYPPSQGIPELRAAVAAHQKAWYGLDFAPDDEVLVTTGATEAIAATLLALCEPGDEVIMFEPTYDSYAACAAMAGAVPRLVRLHAPDWTFDPGELAAAVGPRTRMVLLNTPHNPTGKVFGLEELGHVAALCRAHDVLAVTDEVYEHLVFDGRHIPLATLEGMAGRTVTISSGGKTFSFTGWKVGWVTARAPLVSAIRAAKQFLTYTSGAPYQLAIAQGLSAPAPDIEALGRALRAKRDLFCAGLADLGFTVLRPAATYFATTDIVTAAPGLSAEEFCRALPGRCGVVAIPSSVFYGANGSLASDPGEGRTLVRWAFCKRDDVLLEALVRLASWKR
ncbi:MAG TPA: aminotransferase class I/II-fold pyridoxal phosphate-dependent enzyme, partial [Acidimicrobiales bacterium]|nr:aminotransferase class I/II-fold pyridoxal phosphate-dependent enzyme [Acidimicrobiales bacterium]